MSRPDAITWRGSLAAPPRSVQRQHIHFRLQLREPPKLQIQISPVRTDLLLKLADQRAESSIRSTLSLQLGLQGANSNR